MHIERKRRPAAYGAALLLALAATGARADSATEKPALLHPRNEETYQAILKAAQDPNRDARAAVAWSLARMGRADARATLDALAADPAPEVRAAALRALREILPPRSAITVTLTVPVDDSALRHEALVAARTLLFAQRAELIQAALKSDQALERERAVQALELDAAASGRAALEGALKDPAAPVRAAALRSLGASGDPAVGPLLLAGLGEKSAEPSFLVRAAACDALARLGAKPTPAELLAAVDDTHFLVRRAAIRALAQLREPAGVPAVHGRLTEADYTVRVAACAALGELIAPGSPAPLVARLSDEAPEVRDAAFAALGKFPPELACAAVLRNADIKDAGVRGRCWQLLGEYARPETREPAFACIDDKDLVVRTCAWRILRKLEDRRVIAPTIALLRMRLSFPAPPDPLGDEAYRVATCFKLREPLPDTMFMLNYVANPPATMPAVPPPFSPSMDLVMGGIRYMGALEHQPAVPLLETLFKSWQDDATRGPELSAILEKLTGRPHPVPKRAPEYGVFFIDARTK